MLQFNYYIIDVGENYYHISQKSFVFSLIDAIKEGNDAQIKLAKEFALHKFKKNAPMFSMGEFKVVYVNKQNKLKVKSSLEDSDTHIEYGPIISTKKYDIYIVQPNQRVNIECQVIRNETEIRSLAYTNIVSRQKRKRR